MYKRMHWIVYSTQLQNWFLCKACKNHKILGLQSARTIKLRLRWVDLGAISWYKRNDKSTAKEWRTEETEAHSKIIHFLMNGLQMLGKNLHLSSTILANLQPNCFITNYGKIHPQSHRHDFVVIYTHLSSFSHIYHLIFILVKNHLRFKKKIQSALTSRNAWNSKERERELSVNFTSSYS